MGQQVVDHHRVLAFPDKLGDVPLHGTVEAQQAVLDQDHGRRRRDRLGDGSDGIDSIQFEGRRIGLRRFSVPNR